MAIARPKFNINSTMVVNIPFLFSSKKYATGDIFDKDSCAMQQTRALFNSRKILAKEDPSCPAIGRAEAKAKKARTKAAKTKAAKTKAAKKAQALADKEAKEAKDAQNTADKELAEAVAAQDAADALKEPPTAANQSEDKMSWE